MKPYVYVISDIHGQADLFDALLTDYDPVEHQLVLIGDLNDRGPHSKACFLKGKELVEQHDAVYLRGNHEEYFCSFFKIQRTGLQDMFAMVARKQLKVSCIQELLQNTHQQKWP